MSQNTDPVAGERPRPKRRHARSLTVALVAAAMLAAACGDDSTDTTDTTAAGSATTAAGAGTKADPSKPPVTFGLITQEAGSAGTYPEVQVAAKAAVEHINNELGGVGGSPLKMEVCITDGTVASSQKCAEEMVTKKVLFVQGGLDNNSQAWYGILGPAGVPVIGGIPVAGGDFNSTSAYYFIGGGSTSYSGLAAYTLSKLPNAKNVAILANDTPGAAAALPLIKKPLEAKGVKTKDVKVPGSQADWLAPFASVKDADAVLVLVSSPNCISLAKARLSQQSKVPMVSVSACYSKATIDGAGAEALNGWTVTQNFEDPQGTSADAKEFQAAMTKYAPAGANLSGFAPVGFVDVMTVWSNVLKPLGASATVDKVVAKVKDPAGGKVFMGPTYKCGAAGAPYAAICNYQTQFFAVKDGKLSDPTGFIDLTETIKIGKG